MIIFQATVLKFGDLLGELKLPKNAKFQFNISKITPAKPKNTGTWGVDTAIVLQVSRRIMMTYLHMSI